MAFDTCDLTQIQRASCISIYDVFDGCHAEYIDFYGGSDTCTFLTNAHFDPICCHGALMRNRDKVQSDPIRCIGILECFNGNALYLGACRCR